MGHYMLTMTLAACLFHRSSAIKITRRYGLAINGTFVCDKLYAYATVVGLFQDMWINEEAEHFRISDWRLASRKGHFRLFGRGFVGSHDFHLNITHTCVPQRKRKKYHNCYMNIRAPVWFDESNTASVEFHLEDSQFQLSQAVCEFWQYELPPEAYRDRRYYEARKWNSTAR